MQQVAKTSPIRSKKSDILFQFTLAYYGESQSVFVKRLKQL